MGLISRSEDAHTIAPLLAPGAGHVIIYHLVVKGGAWARLEQGRRVNLGPGEIVVFPHGDPHLMGNGPPTEPVDNGEEIERSQAM